jgi:site-specific recombinase XerD
MDALIPTQGTSYTGDDLKEKSLKVLGSLDVSESTRADYVARISFFLQFVKDNGFDRNSFLNFKRYLAQRNDLSVSTKAKYMTVAKVFLRELHKQGIIPFDVTVNVKGFKQGKKHKRFGLSQEEVNILLENMKLMELNCENYRLKAMLSLLIYQGLRQIEIVRLDVSDICLSRKTALVKGKGSDDKELVDLHPQTVHSIKSYVDCCKIRDGALFVSMSNNNKNGRVTTRTLRDLITGFLKKLQIQNSTHGFRHFFTTRLIELFKADLLTVQKYTRHRSVETLQVYNDNIEKKETLPTYYKGFEF